MRHYLIIDDNRAFADNMADILRDGEADVTIATSAAEALTIASSRSFDTVICDMRMPVVGGAEAVHRLRQLDPGLPAVVVTAYTTDSDLKAAREQGLLAVLPKPVPIPRLVQLLEGAKRDGLVALVEDDHALADNLSEVLRDHGFSTVAAGSVLEAERLKSVRPFVALVDLRVPGGPDGEAMLGLARRFPALPMLVMTAYPDAAPPLPHQAYFTKPFNTGLLLEAVERQYRASHG